MVNAFIQERELFPPAMPFRSGFLQRDKHEIYYEQCGNLDGQPLLFLHGGPGAGIAPAHRRLFDPKRFHVVLFDQRGCGQSRPHASLEDNQTDALIGDIAPHAKRTKRDGASTNLGGFGGLFDIKAAGFHDPILVAATDGVGTKLELAKTTGLHRGVGIDLVAMCANDILAQGAMPLFFLDYFATGKLERGMAVEVIAGIADGCVEADCALIGGETAEMPGMYPAGTYDLAGFCIGAAERGTLLSPG